jgi:hypothetical protein
MRYAFNINIDPYSLNMLCLINFIFIHVIPDIWEGLLTNPSPLNIVLKWTLWSSVYVLLKHSDGVIGNHQVIYLMAFMLTPITKYLNSWSIAVVLDLDLQTTKLLSLSLSFMASTSNWPSSLAGWYNTYFGHIDSITLVSVCPTHPVYCRPPVYYKNKSYLHFVRIYHIYISNSYECWPGLRCLKCHVYAYYFLLIYCLVDALAVHLTTRQRLMSLRHCYDPDNFRQLHLPVPMFLDPYYCTTKLQKLIF